MAIATEVPTIKPLLMEARLRLKSGVALDSLNDAIIGLVKNSLDARASTIRLEVDYLRGNCCVEDDGVGIPACEFEPSGGLGLMHHTSKASTSSETHGQYGRFLASLAASSFLSVASRHGFGQNESNITYYHSRVLQRQPKVAETERVVMERHGTRVVVRDLFGNIPVRIKQRAVHFEASAHVERELDRLRLQITAVALAWSKPAKIVVVSDQHNEKKRRYAVGVKEKAGQHGHLGPRDTQRSSAFRLDDIPTIISHTGYTILSGLDSWTSLSARTSQLFVRAAICLKPAPFKQMQFISLGIRPLEHSSPLSEILYREVNAMFDESAFGTIEVDARMPKADCRQGPNDRQSTRKGKAPDRWPMFYIRIDPRDSTLPTSVLGCDKNDSQAALFLDTAVQLISR